MDKRSDNVAAGVTSCRSRLVQSAGWVKLVLSLSNGQSAPNGQPPVSPFVKGDLGGCSPFIKGELMVSPFSKGELNRMAGGLRRDGSTSSPCTELHPEPVEGSVERLRKS